MTFLYRFLFPLQPEGTGFSLFLLALRIVFGGLLLQHGLQKWAAFEQLSGTFPDPLGVGSRLSLILAVFAEVVCSLAFMTGFLYRLVLIPMIFTLVVAFFVIHGSHAFAEKELAFAYLILYLLMYATGPGKYAVDRLFARKRV